MYFSFIALIENHNLYWWSFWHNIMKWTFLSEFWNPIFWRKTCLDSVLQIFRSSFSVDIYLSFDVLPYAHQHAEKKRNLNGKIRSIKRLLQYASKPWREIKKIYILLFICTKYMHLSLFMVKSVKKFETKLKTGNFLIERTCLMVTWKVAV